MHRGNCLSDERRSDRVLRRRNEGQRNHPLLPRGEGGEMSLSMTKSAVKSREYRRTSAAYNERVQSAEYKKRRAEQMRKWRSEHPGYDRTNVERSLRYQRKHPEKVAAKNRRYRQREIMLIATDATNAEFCRERNRQNHRRYVDKTRIVPYRPMLSRRIPSWMPYGVNPIDRS